MTLLKPYSKIPELNTATILLVENEEQFQYKLADVLIQLEKKVNLNVRLACKLPLPTENEESRPRVDLVVFIVNLRSERSLQVVEQSLTYLSSDYFLGKVCFAVTDARCGAFTQERLLSVRKLAALHRCPLICAEHQTEEGVNAAASRLLTILRVSAGASVLPTSSLYLSAMTCCTMPSDLDED